MGDKRDLDPVGDDRGILAKSPDERATRCSETKKTPRSRRFATVGFQLKTRIGTCRDEVTVVGNLA